MGKSNLSDLARLRHVSEAVDLILGFCKDKNEFDFINDQMLHSSVLYQFIIIGEAVSTIDPGLLRKYSYPWHLPKSFRNYIAHEYFGINLKQVFKTVEELLPEFKQIIDQIIESEKDID
jgi:uncharacterized protein with HEPN domain